MKRKNIFILALFIMVILVTAALVRMYTLKTDIELVQTIELPDLPTLSEMTPGDYQSKAISLDGKILQGTNNKPQPTASTAKIILGLAIMEKKPFAPGEKGETITITPEFYSRYLWYLNHNGSTTAVRIGEEISQYDALASVFLASSNNMADTLAVWAFGSLEEYKTYATDLITSLGLTNTSLGVDASGYSETTISTAEDLSCIAGIFLRNPILKEIVSLESHIVPVAGKIQNTNQILGDSLNNNTVVTGVKTGYIGAASGYNLISSYEMEGHIITEALLGASTRASSFEESKKELLRLSQELAPTVIIKEGERVGYYQTWWSGQHDIIATKGLTVVAPAGNQDTISLTDQTLEVTINGEGYLVETTHEDFIKEPNFIERFLHLFGWQSEQ